MPRAVLKDGVIYPLEPLPPEWKNGMELRVEDAQSFARSPDEIDRKFQELEEAVRQIDPENFAKFEAALQEADLMAKTMVRQEMGLS